MFHDTKNHFESFECFPFSNVLTTTYTYTYLSFSVNIEACQKVLVSQIFFFFRTHPRTLLMFSILHILFCFCYFLFNNFIPFTKFPRRFHHLVVNFFFCCISAKKLSFCSPQHGTVILYISHCVLCALCFVLCIRFQYFLFLCTHFEIYEQSLLKIYTYIRSNTKQPNPFSTESNHHLIPPKMDF